MLPEEEYQQQPLSDTELQIIEAQEAARLEAEQLALYADQVFAKTHPKPIPPVLTEYSIVPYEWKEFDMKNVTFLNERGVEAAVNAIATVGGIVFSAIRTAGIFAIMELKLLASYSIQPATQNWLGFISGVSVIAVVEGVLVGLGWVRGRNSGKTNTSWAPLILAASIGAVAGVLPAFELLPESTGTTWWYNFVLIALTILSGPGIAFLLIVVTENFGHLYNNWIEDVNDRIAAHKAEQKQRKADWDADQRRKQQEHYARQDQIKAAFEAANESWYEMLQDDYRRRGRTLLFGRESFTVKRNHSNNGGTPKPQETKATPGVTELVRQYLAEHDLRPDQVGEGDGFVISPMGIAQAMQIFKKDGVTYNNSAVRTALSRMR